MQILLILVPKIYFLGAQPQGGQKWQPKLAVMILLLQQTYCPENRGRWLVPILSLCFLVFCCPVILLTACQAQFQWFATPTQRREKHYQLRYQWPLSSLQTEALASSGSKQMAAHVRPSMGFKNPGFWLPHLPGEGNFWFTFSGEMKHVAGVLVLDRWCHLIVSPRAIIICSSIRGSILVVLVFELGALHFLGRQATIQGLFLVIL
jgi:hypothetical protein